jgi:beta-hydroxylase
LKRCGSARVALTQGFAKTEFRMQLTHIHFWRDAILLIFALCGVYVHFRGHLRHRWTRQILDHSTIMAPYNVLMYVFSAVPTRPFVDLERFPQLEPLRENWQVLRDEGLRLFDEGYIRAAAKYNDLGFNSFFRRGWKRFYLKWYGDFLPSAQNLCPKSTQLLAGIPSVKAAMFAVLPPGSKLGKHRDPFAGSLRYHLGLSTPNSPKCWINVDGERYYWKDGEAVMFDETYIHHAANETDQTRLILFCDIDRPLSNPVARALNRHVGRPLAKAAATQNVEGEKIGVLNHLFGYAYQIRVLGKKIQAWNKPIYHVLKWGLIGGAAYAIFLR